MNNQIRARKALNTAHIILKEILFKRDSIKKATTPVPGIVAFLMGE